MDSTEFALLKQSEIPFPFRHRRRSHIRSGTVHALVDIFSLCYDESHHSPSNETATKKPEQDNEDGHRTQETERKQKDEPASYCVALSDNPLVKEVMMTDESAEKITPRGDCFLDAGSSIENELADINTQEGNNSLPSSLASSADKWKCNPIPSLDNHVTSVDFGSTENDRSWNNENDVDKSYPGPSVSGCFLIPNPNDMAEEGEISEGFDLPKEKFLEGKVSVRQDVEKHIDTTSSNSICDEFIDQMGVHMTDKEPMIFTCAENIADRHVEGVQLIETKTDCNPVVQVKNVRTEVSSRNVERDIVHYGDIGSLLSDHADSLSPHDISKEKAKIENVDIGKKKRQKLTKEAKEKKKRKDRLKRAEKNRKLGVKRLKLPPMSEPKPITYCRHYLKGRCHKGNECTFSHDTIPLTKSSPCCHFVRRTCMKGDECPFDHQLSKYPCNNFTSKGFCSRGDACMFSHKVVGNPSQPDPKSSGPFAVASNREKVHNAKSAPQPPKGANPLSLEKSTPLSKVHSTQQPASLTQPVKCPIVPKGINFLSFGAPHKDRTCELSDEGRTVKCETPKQALSSITPRTDLLRKSSSSGESTAAASRDASVKALFGSQLNRDGQNGFEPSMASKSLASTLAFAARYDSLVKMNHPLMGGRGSNCSIAGGGSQSESLKASRILDFLYGVTNKSNEGGS